MNQVWTTPHRATPVDAVVALPGSKSLTARALVLAALADGPSRLVRPLRARDTDLMAAGLRALGAAGTAVVYVVPFDAALAAMPAEDFVEAVLHRG